MRANATDGKKHEGDRTATAKAEWQQQMFSRSLKKRQKVELLLEQIGDTSDKRCLLITNGDNNGILNLQFRRHGGDWTWVENEPEQIPEIEAFLDETVLPGRADSIPAADGSFDVVVSIDVHEHLEDCRPFNRELHRVTKPGGTTVVTTPNGGNWRPLTLLKNLVGMTPDKYGHQVVGYTVGQHESMLRDVGLKPIDSGSYSHFFTELIELMINFAYVMVLSRKATRQRPEGRIAPSSSDELRAMNKQFELYSRVFPLLRAFSALDLLLFPFNGYAVSVVARRP
jgi:2-polyprenyl-3-methyl-5-hydroxy-6-metoxy-1,4-benzoquinol methylase